VKFLADMGLAHNTMVFLRSQGHDALHLRDQGLQRLSDNEIIEKARAENRIILTHDLDFGRIIALSGAQIPSVITFRLANMKPTAVNQHLSEILARFAPKLERGALISVSEWSVRVRSLPIDTEK
jgi:predicted nuclease of predicted toxin-antitoxin system